MFIAAPFTVIDRWKQLECPSTDKHINMRSIHVMEYYPVIKGVTSDTVLMRVSLEHTMLSESSVWKF